MKMEQACKCLHHATLGQGFNSPHLHHFCFAKMVNEACQGFRFMHRRCASYILMLDEQSSQAQNVLHKNAFSDLARRSKAKTAEALFQSSFHSAMKHCSVTLHNMKHSAYAPYDEKNEKVRVMFANIPGLCGMIQWKEKISWKKLQINLSIFQLPLLLKY